MDYFQIILIALATLVIGSNLWARLKYGSWTGGFLQGKVEKTYGEVLVPRGTASSQLVKVVELSSSGGESLIGIVITSKAPLSVHWTYYRMPKEQALELATLLALAAK